MIRGFGVNKAASDFYLVVRFIIWFLSLIIILMDFTRLLQVVWFGGGSARFSRTWSLISQVLGGPLQYTLYKGYAGGWTVSYTIFFLNWLINCLQSLSTSTSTSTTEYGFAEGAVRCGTRVAVPVEPILPHSIRCGFCNYRVRVHKCAYSAGRGLVYQDWSVR